MKKLVILAVLMLVGCRDPYFAAQSTITIARGAVVMSQTGFDTYVKVETDKCTTQCKAEPVCVKKCLEPVEADTVIFNKSKAAAVAGLNASQDILNTAKQLKQGVPVDWLSPIKATACLIAKGLDFLKPEYKQKVQPLLDLLNSFGCMSAK